MMYELREVRLWVVDLSSAAASQPICVIALFAHRLYILSLYARTTRSHWGFTIVLTARRRAEDHAETCTPSVEKGNKQQIGWLAVVMSAQPASARRMHVYAVHKIHATACVWVRFVVEWRILWCRSTRAFFKHCTRTHQHMHIGNTCLSMRVCVCREGLHDKPDAKSMEANARV